MRKNGSSNPSCFGKRAVVVIRSHGGFCRTQRFKGSARKKLRLPLSLLLPPRIHPELSLSPHVVLCHTGHGTRFGQWDNSKHDASWGSKKRVCWGLLSLSLFMGTLRPLLCKQARTGRLWQDTRPRHLHCPTWNWADIWHGSEHILDHTSLAKPSADHRDLRTIQPTTAPPMHKSWEIW